MLSQNDKSAVVEIRDKATERWPKALIKGFKDASFLKESVAGSITCTLTKDGDVWRVGGGTEAMGDPAPLVDYAA